jgi:1,4-dihydroxy-6-naphthoate synthase
VLNFVPFRGPFLVRRLGGLRLESRSGKLDRQAGCQRPEPSDGLPSFDDRRLKLEGNAMQTTTHTIIRVGHSPDPDDAFMFHALANGKIETGAFEFRHELVDIETLNRRAFAGELELTALSVHAYAHLADKYVLCSCGASMGDCYGPMVVTREPMLLDQLRGRTIAIPGTLTSAYLALRLCMGTSFDHVVVPFDQILAAVTAGQWEGRTIDAGLIIHEGQLTFGDLDLNLVVDLGRWWYEKTGLPLPLGANAVRRDLGPETVKEVTRLLKASIEYGLEHRDEALDYAMQFGRDLDRSRTDRFVGMYVNEWTLDFGPRGRQAVQLLLDRGFAAGVIPTQISAEFIEP